MEFWPLAQILDRCGPDGVRAAYLPEQASGSPVYGRITDDTQMTLFTIEGLIRASVRTDRGLGLTIAVVHHAYDRWLDTQLLAAPSGRRDGWLANETWLYARRAPGNTCLTALTSGRRCGDTWVGQFGIAATNDSKGCGGVMRSAPFGLLPSQPAAADAFPSSRWPQRQPASPMVTPPASSPPGHSRSSSVRWYAVIPLDRAVENALALLERYPGHEETSGAVQRARSAARRGADFATMESLGQGWTAEEALAMAVYAALARPEPDHLRDALALAVTHSGDSDSTGSICGNILGAWHGETALPAELAFEVEGRGTILQLADDLVSELTCKTDLHGDPGPATRWTERYPGW